MFDLEGVARSLLDEFRDTVAVQRTPTEGPENDQVQSALHDFQAWGFPSAIHG